MTNYIKMTNKDLDIKYVMDRLLNKEITNIKAGELLCLGKRQIIRKKKKYKVEGVKGLIHKARGSPSNHKHNSISLEKKRKEKYDDYNIIHFREKLKEKHNIEISYGTLRNELI